MVENLHRVIYNSRMTMDIVRTAKVKIDLDIDVAKRTIQQWNVACNYISQVAFANLSVAYNTIKLNSLTYATVKADFGLSAQVTQNAVRQVSAKYQSAKTSKTNLKQAIYFKPGNAIALQGGDRGRDFGFRSRQKAPA